MFKFNVSINQNDGGTAQFSNCTDIDLNGQRLSVLDLKTRRLQDIDLSNVSSIHISVAKEDRGES
jgi:hypothetical protein